MTADDFRSLALENPDASESSHMNHPDFRVGGKIFATLAHDESWGMVKLTPEQQLTFVRTEPQVFQPAKGAWGRQGCTQVCLELASESTVRQAVTAAYQNVAAKEMKKSGKRKRTR